MATSSVDPYCEWTLRKTILPFIRTVWRPTLVETGHFPQGPCFVYGNHSHNLDPFILNLFTAWRNPTSGVLTMEYMRKGLVAYLLKGIGLLATRKSVPEPHLIRSIYKLLDEGRMVVIYPEGGRRWAGRPEPWMLSTAKIFARAGVPIYPVVTHGSYIGWPRWARWPRRARIQVEVKAPFQFPKKSDWRTVVKQLKKPIDIDENIVDPAIRPSRAYRPAEGIEKLLYRDPETGVYGDVFSPDGTYVVNRSGTMRLKMLPDSTLLDEATGEVKLTGDLYEHIRALPTTRSADGAYIRNNVAVYEEIAYPDLHPLGRADVRLFDDALRLQYRHETQTIGLDDIRFTSLERNAKLQLTLDDRMVQLHFDREGSALAWSDALRTLKGPDPSLV